MSSYTCREFDPRSRSATSAVVDACHDHGLDVNVVEWTTAERVRTAMGVNPFDTVDDQYLQHCVAATNQAVSYWRFDLTARLVAAMERVSPFTTDFNEAFGAAQAKIVGTNPMVQLGADTLAARLYRRRNADDAASFDPFVGVARLLDQDIESLLCIGRAFHPVVA